MRIQVRSTVRRHSVAIFASAIVLIAGVYVSIVSLQRETAAAFVPESCFTFNSGTGTIEDYNAAANPLCLDDVTIPATIGGTPVTTIQNSAFDNPTLTDVTFPSSITLIETEAFPSASVALDSITLSAAGDLTIQAGAFTVYNGTDLSISAAGNLVIDGSFGGSVNLTTLNLSAGGNLTIGSVGFPNVVTDAVDLSAGGTITVWQGSFPAADLGAITMDAVGDITITQGSMVGSSFAFESALIESDANITIEQGALSQMSSPVDSVTVDAGGALSVDSSALGSFTVGSIDLASVGTLTINASLDNITADSLTVTGGNNVTVTSAGNGLTILNSSYTAGGALTLDSSLYNFGNVAEMNIALESGTGLMTIDASISSDDSLETLTITAPNGLDSLNGSLYELTALANVTLSLGGNVLLENGAFAFSIVPVLSIETDGDVSAPGGTFGDNTELTELTIDAGGDITIGAFDDLPALTDVTFTSGGDMEITAGTFSSSPLVETASLISSGTMTIGSSVLSDNQLSSLVLQAGGATTIATYAFYNTNITELTLPATTVSIGTLAFALTNLDRVYIAGSPTIGDGVFTLSGASYNNDTSEYENLDQVKYVQLYTVDPLNPAGYVDTIEPPDDLSDNVELDPVGGYLVNRAYITAPYENSNGVTLLPTEIEVGELSDGTLLTSYLASANPNDFTAYYLPGDVLTRTAPAIQGYITPDPIQLTLAQGNNVVAFVYVAPTTGVPNTGLAGTENPSMSVIIASIVLAGGIIALITGIRRLLGVYEEHGRS